MLRRGEGRLLSSFAFFDKKLLTGMYSLEDFNIQNIEVLQLYQRAKLQDQSFQ